MKKKLSAALILAVAVTLTACSREEIPLDIPVTESQTTALLTETENVGSTETEQTEITTAEITAAVTAAVASEITEATETEIAAAVTQPPATTAYVTEAPKPEWTETPVSPKAMYINSEGVYSRVKPVQGSTRVNALSFNQSVTVCAKTDTAYFKIEGGSYVHSAFLSSEKTEITTTTTTAATTTTTTTPPPVTDEPEPQIIGQYNQRSQTQAEIDFANKVFDLTNAEREKAGLPKLKKMDAITQMATTRAWELTITPTHKRPDGSKSSSVLNGMPYSAVGENLAAGQATPEEVVKAWMDSEHHRDNILSADYEYLGVGYYNVVGTTYTNYWIQTFYS